MGRCWWCICWISELGDTFFWGVVVTMGKSRGVGGRDIVTATASTVKSVRAHEAN